jgi:hypothetical protein
MANWKFLQLERAMLVLRIVASSWHSLKIEKEGVGYISCDSVKINNNNKKSVTVNKQ